LIFAVFYVIIREVGITQKGFPMTIDNNNLCENHSCSSHNCEKHSVHAHHDNDIKQNVFVYRMIRGLANAVSVFMFKRKFIRNEIKGKKGPFVIIANHEAALDFVNLIGATRRPITFVISNSFYNTLPCRPIVSRLGMIPKQQFQTSLKDIHRMKSTLTDGKILAFYPAGLMSEDGNPTPTPAATYHFLKLIKADIYVARSYGTYFSMPKWRVGGIRRGRTYIDIYKLFDKDALATTEVSDIRAKVEEALGFDAYAEQEKLLVKFRHGNDIRGLENVLYMCPNCKTEFDMHVSGIDTIRCGACGFEERSDEYAFLHSTGGIGREIRHISEWGRFIHDDLRERIAKGEDTAIVSTCEIHELIPGKRRYEKCGDATVTLSEECFRLVGDIHGESTDMTIPIANFASLPFKPGKYIEIQHNDKTLRCYPEDGRIVMKYINMTKVFYEIHNENFENDQKMQKRECQNATK